MVRIIFQGGGEVWITYVLFKVSNTSNLILSHNFNLVLIYFVKTEMILNNCLLPITYLPLYPLIIYFSSGAQNRVCARTEVPTSSRTEMHHSIRGQVPNHSG